MIPRVRTVSSLPQMHRGDTLRSIADKAHDLTARVQFLQVEAERVNDILSRVPADTTSRLDWLNRQLGGSV